jgi:hypothetical protein
MDTNRQSCFACTGVRKLTDEHVIPQALGGKLRAKIYCKECNGTFGKTIDSELSIQLGRYATILNLKRERSNPRSFNVEELRNNTALVFNGKGFRRKDPEIKVRLGQDGKTVKSLDVTARSKKELDKIVASVQNKYNVPGNTKTFYEDHPGPTDTRYDFVVDNDLMRRGVAKIAYSFICLKLPRDLVFSDSFAKIRHYIVDSTGSALASPNFRHTQFMTDYVRPLHKIHVSLNRQEKIVIGFVMLFGIFRYTILLCSDLNSSFEWPGLDYTFDPVTSKAVSGNPNFRAPDLNKAEILNPRQSKRLLIEELSKGHKILESYANGYKFLGIEKGA